MSTSTFALHDLGWFAFEQLCHTILREVLGQSVQSFAVGTDGGRDGAFKGIWAQEAKETFSGKFVVQCKHKSKPGVNLQFSDVDDELPKIRELVAEGECDTYILMTNAGLPAATEKKIRQAIKRLGVKDVAIFGSQWIDQTIRESPRVRRLVPRLYGLGDLTQILDERAYQQAREVLDFMRVELAKLVRTATYEAAADAVESHGFVLLLGAPATGKTTIAAQLALGASDEFDTEVVLLDSASDFQERWNPNERQFFWIDDAFGATQLDHSMANAWTAALPRIMSAINNGSKVVLTSRDYIYQAARRYLKPGSFPLFEESQVVVNVEDLTLTERRQILYNHLRHGTQPKSWLRRLHSNLDAVASHSGFSPELARRLSDPSFTSKVVPESIASVESFLARPNQFLRDVMEGLDSNLNAALGLIFVHHNWLSSPVTPDERSQDLIARLGGDIGGVIQGLQVMNGSLVSNVRRDGQNGWVFAHPTMVDAYSKLMRSPDLVDHLLVGFPLETLMREITCGDVGIEGALIVNEPHYNAVLERLEEPFEGSLADRWLKERYRMNFLASRCDRVFLELWCARNTEKLEQMSTPGLRVQWSSENSLVVELHKQGLYPEALRSKFVAELADYCLEGIDPGVLFNADLQSVFTSSEWARLKQRIWEELLPNLESRFEYFVSDLDLEDSEAEWEAQDYLRLADELLTMYPNEPYVEGQVCALRSHISEWISDNEQPCSSEEVTPASTKIHSTVPETSERSRSIFDDLLDD